MNKIMRHVALFCIGAGLALLLVNLPLMLIEAMPAAAQEPEATEEPAVDVEPAPDVEDETDMLPEIDLSAIDSGYCLLCHGDPAAGDDVHVDVSALAGSVHGIGNPEGALTCLDCHGEMTFPHENTDLLDERMETVLATENCVECHEEQGSAMADSVHADGLAMGNLRSATCIDCHGAHDIMSVEDSPQIATLICADCHVTIYDEYATSVHGEALLVHDDFNAPGCTDCHGVHGINDPTTAMARNRSPQLCADCHADEDLMDNYGISTNVFNSYVSEFHGTTVTLFEQQDPDVPSNKAVCFDCHGVHNILAADDDKSRVAKENLLATCQECHPNATAEDFPDTWVGHFEPTAEENPAFFAVAWFYRILIPTVLGGFTIFVVSDIFGRLRGRSHHPDEHKE